MTADDDLILVDADDQQVGTMNKARCHDGRGVLHRAFSLLIFNAGSQLLIQQRSPAKRLWPLFWSNSCCSHPRSGEGVEQAARRRLHEELGLECRLQFLYKFQYHAQFDARGAERELCSVFIGRCSTAPRVDPREIAAWRWIGTEELETEMSLQGPIKFTPWFREEWARVGGDYRDTVRALT